MSAFFGPPKLSEIDTPEMLLFYLRKRKHWRDLRSDILETIFANAFGNIERLREFVELSEKFKLVENNFLKLQGRGHPPLNSLSSFSLTCLRLAGDLLNLEAPEGSEKKKQSRLDAFVQRFPLTSSCQCK